MKPKKTKGFYDVIFRTRTYFSVFRTRFIVVVIEMEKYGNYVWWNYWNRFRFRWPTLISLLWIYARLCTCVNVLLILWVYVNTYEHRIVGRVYYTTRELAERKWKLIMYTFRMRYFVIGRRSVDKLDDVMCVVRWRDTKNSPSASPQKTTNRIDRLCISHSFRRRFALITKNFRTSLKLKER